MTEPRDPRGPALDCARLTTAIIFHPSTMLNPASLNQFLEAQFPVALEMLRQMVGINSFTLNRAGLKQLGQFTADAFAPLGFTAEFVPSTNPNFGEHLVLTRRGHGPKKPRPDLASRHRVPAGGRGAQ